MIEQKNNKPTVMVYGKSLVVQRPQWFLMQFNLVSNGGSVDESLDDMRAKCLRARERLESAKAAEIEIDSPVLGNGDEPNPLSAAYAGSIAARRSGASSPSVGSNSVFVRVKAKWPLHRASDEDATRFCHQLIKSLSDLGQAPAVEIPPVNLSTDFAQQQIEAIKAKSLPRPHDNRNPSFYFVSRLEQPEFQQAFADAAANGRAQAEMVAKASGHTLGELSSVSVLNQPWEFASRRQHVHQQIDGKDWPDEDATEPEVISQSGKKTRFVVTLMMTFNLA